MTIASGTSGMQMTTTADDGTLTTYARRNEPSGSCHYRIRALIQVDTAEQQVIWLGRVPMTTGAGVGIGVINLQAGSKISTINVGDTADFSDNTEIARSTTTPGTVPVSGGGTTLDDTGVSNGDRYELIFEQSGNTIMFQCRNFTRGNPPLRLTAVCDNESPAGTAHVIPSPGYPAVGSILNNSTVEVIEFEYEDLTVHQPEWLVLTDSQVNVDAAYDDSLFFLMNELRAPDAVLKTQWIAEWGSPGSRIQELTDCDTTTGDIEAIAPQRVAIMCGPNSYGSIGAAAAETDLEELQDQILTWGTLPTEIMHVAHPVLTAGGVTSGSWRTNQATVAALTGLGTTTDDGWTATGNPTGTDTQEATYFDDAVHTNAAGKSAWATAEHNSTNWT